MERRVTVLVANFFLLLALPGAAQQESGTLAQEFWIKVKPSMARDFEAAYGAAAEFAFALGKSTKVSGTAICHPEERRGLQWSVVKEKDQPMCWCFRIRTGLI